MHTDFHAFVRQIYARDFRASFWTLKIHAFCSVTFASYLVSVRQTSVLLSASFRFRLTADTLAVQLAVPLAGPALDFNQLVSAPCRAHKEKRPDTTPASSTTH